MSWGDRNVAYLPDANRMAGESSLTGILHNKKLFDSAWGEDKSGCMRFRVIFMTRHDPPVIYIDGLEISSDLFHSGSASEPIYLRISAGFAHCGGTEAILETIKGICSSYEAYDPMMVLDYVWEFSGNAISINPKRVKKLLLNIRIPRRRAWGFFRTVEKNLPHYVKSISVQKL